jgi:uncharacterized protein DUF4440
VGTVTTDHQTDLLGVARRVFTATDARDWERFSELIHPDAILALRSQPDRVIHGREEMLEFARSVISPRRAHEVSVERIEQIAPDAVVAIGRLFISDERGVIDAAVGWLMLFEDGMLRRSWLVDSVERARAILADHLLAPAS